MSNKNVHALIVRDANTALSDAEAIKSQCQSLCEKLAVKLKVDVLSSSAALLDQLQSIAQEVDALIISNEAYSQGKPASFAKEHGSFDSTVLRGIPVVEVREGKTPAYLDSPAVGAALVSGMGLNSYKLAIRALVAKLESKAA